MNPINRRSALRLFGSATILPAAAQAAQPGKLSFAHGVASGDPLADRAILWTRVTPDDPSVAGIPLRYHVAESEGGKPFATGAVEARASADFTAKTDAKGLKPGTDYWYWFEAPDGTLSPKGRFRTLPVGKAEDVVLAVVSCQLFQGGYFNAYNDLARRPRLDAVLHLGDYIYEYGASGYGAEIGAKLGREARPAHEIVTLADYRERHAQYKSDPDLQAAHARAAFICVWDDHEVANDGWLHGAQNHQPESEGDWNKRKAAAMQAYFEWMPIREPIPGRAWEAINRSFQFGDLTTLLMVETRLLARSEQVRPKGAELSAADYPKILADRARPDRELLGKAQSDWLAKELTASVASGRVWQLIGNQTVMARVMMPDVEASMNAEMYADTLSSFSETSQKGFKAAIAASRAGVPMNLDGWDGYPAARERLYELFRKAKARPIVLSGDSHAFWANDLFDEKGVLVANEFGTSAISSPSWGDALPSFDLGEALYNANDEVVWCNQNVKGYVLLTLTPEFARAEMIGVSTVTARPYGTMTIAAFETGAGPAPSKLDQTG